MQNSIIKGSSSTSKTYHSKRNTSPYDMLSSKSVDKKYMFKSYLFPTNQEEQKTKSNKKVLFSKQLAPSIPLSSRNKFNTQASNFSNIQRIHQRKPKQFSTTTNIFRKGGKDNIISKLISIVADSNRKHQVIKGIDIKSRNNFLNPKRHMNYNSINV